MDALFNDADEFSTRFLSQIFEFCEPSVLASMSLCCRRFQLLAFARLKTSVTRTKLESDLEEQTLQFYVMIGRLAAFPQDKTLLRYPQRPYINVRYGSHLCCLLATILLGVEATNIKYLKDRKWTTPIIFAGRTLTEQWEALQFCDAEMPVVFISAELLYGSSMPIIHLRSFGSSIEEAADERLCAELRLICLFHAYRYEFIMH